MNYPKSISKKATLKNIIGILLIGFSVTSICWLMVFSSEEDYTSLNLRVYRNCISK